MFLPCATVRRVMPGQISIIGFSRFMLRRLRGKVGGANISFLASHLSLAICRRLLAESSHENTHAISHNSVCDIDRSSLICAKPSRIARCGDKLCGGSDGAAERSRHDEANDGDVETKRESQAPHRPRRQLELHHQVLDEPRSKRAATAIQRHCYPQKRYGRSLRDDGCEWQNADA